MFIRALSIALCAESACFLSRDVFEKRKKKERKPLAGILYLTTLLAFSGLVQPFFFFTFPRAHVISLAAPACASRDARLASFWKKSKISCLTSVFLFVSEVAHHGLFSRVSIVLPQIAKVFQIGPLPRCSGSSVAFAARLLLPRRRYFASTAFIVFFSRLTFPALWAHLTNKR